MAELIPGLQPLVLWMANSIELLHFVQHEVPLLLPWTKQDEEQDKGTFSQLILMLQIVHWFVCTSFKIDLDNSRYP